MVFLLQVDYGRVAVVSDCDFGGSVSEILTPPIDRRAGAIARGAIPIADPRAGRA